MRGQQITGDIDANLKGFQFCRTVFPRIVVHASIYETEAMVHAPKVSPKCTFFQPQKNRAVSYISACHCRDLKISLPI